MTQVEQIEATELSLEKFSPTVAELKKMVEQTKEISAIDPKDAKSLKIVKEHRIGLRNARIAITKRGKELREGAVKFQKAVIEKERELVAIIEPEEERLGGIEEKAAIEAAREKNRDKLPWRKEQLALYVDELKEYDIELTEENLLDMGDDEFNGLRVELQEKKNKKEADRIEAEKQRLAAESAEIDRKREEQEKRDKEQAELEKRRGELPKRRQRLSEVGATRTDEELLALDDSQFEKVIEGVKVENARKEQEEKDRKAREELEEKQRQEAEEKKKKDEQEKLEADKKFAKFKADSGWTEETKDQFREEKVGNEIILWKKVGTFKIK